MILRHWILAMCLVLGLAACTPPSPQVSEPETPLIWPSAPDPPRIAYVRAFSRPDDLGISKGFWQRLVDAVFGESEARLIRPMAVVAVGTVIYVADPGARGVHRFDPVNGRHELLRAPRDVPLPSPVGLARGADGEVYVTDSVLGKVFVLRPDEKAATELALGAALGQPTGIAFDPASRRLFVVDTSAHRIEIFERDGKHVASIGKRGTENGEFNYPTLIWRSAQGQLYVTDSLNFRIQILNERGQYVAKFGRHGDGTGDLARQKGVATDRFGHIYVVDSLFHAVQIFDPTGAFLLSVGAIGHARGEFWLPTGIFISEDDTVYVADSYNQRVQVFRYIGGPT
jgi:sugar lactone lactonase YvrE